MQEKKKSRGPLKALVVVLVVLAVLYGVATGLSLRYFKSANAVRAVVGYFTIATGDEVYAQVKGGDEPVFVAKPYAQSRPALNLFMQQYGYEESGEEDGVVSFASGQSTIRVRAEGGNNLFARWIFLDPLPE